MNAPSVTRAMQLAFREKIRGGVSFDPVVRGMHATDASHYQIIPACVVTPLDTADVITALQLAAEYNMPITPRGGATALSGQTFGPGMVLDLSRHLNRVLEINPEQGWARVQAGVVRDRLNDQLREHCLQFAPDPATTSRATIGGMLGNNSAGMRSLVHGKTIDHTLSCQVALAGGASYHFEPHSAAAFQQQAQGNTSEALLYRAVGGIVAAHRDEILRRYPRVMRRVSGYNLDEFVDGAGYVGPIGPRDHGARRPWNLTNLVVGAEGTLATVLEAKVRLVALPPATGLCVLSFDDEIASLAAVPAILDDVPSAIEMLDGAMLREAQVNPATHHLADWIHGPPQAVLIVEFSGPLAEVEQRVRDFAARSVQLGISQPCSIVLDQVGQQKIWETRRLGLGLISNVRGPVKGLAAVEDACLPVEVLAPYIQRMQDLCQKYGVASSMYGHASVGVIHFRPVLDLHRVEHRQLMHKIASASLEMVLEYGGAFAGEHGDGQLRGEFVPRFFGSQLYEAFRQIKRAFDPQNLMNPGKIVDAPSMIDPATLRYGTHYQEHSIPTAFRYADQGGFQLAVEQCNGLGACRQINRGTMCPSYQATREEKDSTRGRANALRLAMSGQLGTDPLAALGSAGVHDVLDLCLSCKACKSECPNAVDMSRLKAEALQIRYDHQGTPRTARLLGSFPDQLRRLGTRWGVASKLLLKLPGARRLIHHSLGLDPRRPLPQAAPRNLAALLQDRPTKDIAASREKVVLFDDTYANYLEPHIGLAAVTLLEGLGYEVVLARAGCCQRPRLSQGLVHEAKRFGATTMAQLDHYARQGLPILCLEPSCASALADDLPDLIDDQPLGRRVAGQVQLLETFLAHQGVPLQSTADRCLLHGHCHQAALFGTESLRALFATVAGASLTEVDAGCCGMAGAFGYQHYDLSEQIGEQRLFPAVRQATAAGHTILASGTSCRQQLRDFLGVPAQHWVEFVQPRKRCQEPLLVGEPFCPQ